MCTLFVPKPRRLDGVHVFLGGHFEVKSALSDDICTFYLCVYETFWLFCSTFILYILYYL